MRARRCEASIALSPCYCCLPSRASREARFYSGTALCRAASGYSRPAGPASCVASQAQIGQARMIVRAAAERPAKLSFGFLDRQIVDACDATLHQALFVELPVLVAVGAKPVSRIVVPLVGEAHRNARFVQRPQFLEQSVEIGRAHV